ncbi:MAG: protein kinase [Phycisphaeraceae bacterium]|nr:protein kinase [Phycisphaeraceae bacterium]
MRRLFAAALERPKSERADFVHRKCRDDPALAAEIMALLAEASRETAFMEAPIVSTEGAAQAIAEASHDPSVGLEGQRIGSFTIGRLIGAGGMGRVYEAEQSSPRRKIAFKVLASHAMSPALARRFAMEAEALGQLDHPGIARVLEAGVHRMPHGALPYIAMELVPDAQSILAYADAQGLASHERVALVVQACEAIEHAHSRGFIHRDLKPSNLLVGSDGRLRVIDFGIAKPTAAASMERSMATLTGEMVGTPKYMSPEQCEGRPAAITVRSDVYALGLVLYELLAGRPPFDFPADSFIAVADVIRTHDPRRLRTLAPALGSEFDAVVMRAIERDPVARYASARELAEDLNRALAGEPVQARPLTFSRQLRRLARRYPVPVAAGAVAVAGLLLVSVISLVALLVVVATNRALDESYAELERSTRTAENERATRELTQRQISTAEAAAALNGGDVRGAQHALAGLPADYTPWEAQHLRGRADLAAVMIESAKGEFRFALPFSDGDDLLTLTSEAGGPVMLHRFGLNGASKGREAPSLDPSVIEALTSESGRFDRTCARFRSPDGRDGYIMSNGFVLLQLEWADGGLRCNLVQELLRPTAHLGVRNLTCDPTGRIIAAVTYSAPSESDVGIWLLRRKDDGRFERYHFLDASTPAYTLASFSPDGRTLAVSRANVITLYEIDDEGIPRECGHLTGHSHYINDMTFSSDGTLLATASSDRSAILWSVNEARAAFEARQRGALPEEVVEAEHRTRIGTAENLGSAAFSIATSPADPDLFAVADGSNDIMLFRLERSGGSARVRQEATLKGHTVPPYSLRFSDCGRWLISYCSQSARLWVPADSDGITSLPYLTSGVRAVDFSRCGQLAFVAGQNSWLTIWEIDRPGAPIFWEQLPGPSISALAVLPRFNTMLMAHGGGAMSIWDIADERAPRLRRSLSWPASVATQAVLAATENGERFIFANCGVSRWGGADLTEGSIVVVGELEWINGEVEVRLRERCHVPAPVASLALSPSGRVAAFSRLDGGVFLLDLDSNDEARELRVDAAHDPGGRSSIEPVSTLVFVDQETLLAGHKDGPVSRISFGGGRVVVEPYGTAGGAHSEAISSISLATQCDPPRIFTSSLDGTIKVWDPRTRTTVATLGGSARSVLFLRASADPSGRVRLLTGSAGFGGLGNAARLWEADIDRPTRVHRERWRLQMDRAAKWLWHHLSTSPTDTPLDAEALLAQALAVGGFTDDELRAAQGQLVNSPMALARPLNRAWLLWLEELASAQALRNGDPTAVSQVDDTASAIRRQEASRWLDWCEQLNPNCSELLLIRAGLAQCAGEPARALELLDAFDRRLTEGLTANHGVAVATRVDALLSMGRIDDAEELIRAMPPSSSAWFPASVEGAARKIFDREVRVARLMAIRAERHNNDSRETLADAPPSAYRTSDHDPAVDPPGGPPLP